MTATDMCPATSPRAAGGHTITICCEKSHNHHGPHLAGGYAWTTDTTGRRHHTKITPGSPLP